MAFKIKDGLTVGTKVVTDSSGNLDSPIVLTGLTTSSTSFNLLNTTATTVNAFGAATAITIGAAGANTLTLNPGTVVGSQTTQNLFNTVATTLNIGGAATATTIGAAGANTLTLNPGTVVGSQTTQNLFNTVATTLNIGGAANVAVNIGANGGTASILNSTVTLTNATALNINGVSPTLASTSIGTLTLFNTALTTVTAFGAATSITLGGSTAAQTVNLATGAHTSGTKAINIGTAGTAGGTTTVVLGTSSGGTSSVTANGQFAFKSGAATITFATGATGSQTYTWPLVVPTAGQVLTSDVSGNLSWASAGAATTATSLASGSIGQIPYQSAASTTAFLSANTTTTPQFVTSTGNGSAGLAPTLTSSTGSGNVVLATSPSIATSLATGSASFDLVNTTATTVNFAGAATALSIGASTGTTTINNANVIITGNLTVNGTTTTINSTTVTVDDIVVELGAVATPTDTTANGGGISLLGTTNKTILWDTTNANWTSSENWNLATGKVFKINNVQVLSATTLGSAVTSSSLTSVGTLSGLTVGTSALQLNGVDLQLAPTTTPRIYRRAVQPAAIAVNTAATLDTFAAATYRSAKYLIQIVQGTKYQISEYRLIHDGTTTYATEFSVLETNTGSPIPVTFTSSISTGTLSVFATITDAATTNATVTMERTLFAV
jgi:uncharacterized membrane protein